MKDQLRAATDLAITRGVFGVPTFELDGRLFWGVDALPMLRAALRGEAWFDGPGLGRRRAGPTRRRALNGSTRLGTVSATASAVMLTTRRTVADGVRMCTGACRAQQDRADRDAVAAGDLQHVEQDVGRVEVGQHQQVGLAGQRAVGQEALRRIVLGQRRVAVHLAVAFARPGAARTNSSRARAHAFAPRRAATSRSIECDRKATLRRQAEAAHFVGGHRARCRPAARRSGRR